jgi:uncharacterized protein (TIGR03067 family)
MKHTEMVFVYGDGRFTDEYNKLNGEWHVDLLEYDGKKYNARDLDGSAMPGKLIVTAVAPVGIEKRCDIYRIDVDPTKSPMRLKAVIAGGEIKGQWVLGIYSFEGRELTLLLSGLGAKDYPKDFNPQAQDGTILMRLGKGSRR